MRGQHKHLGNLNMGWGRGGIEHYICNIVARERFDAFIDIVGTSIIAMETYIREVGFYKARLDIGYANSRVGHVDAKAISDGLNGRLSGAIHISASIGGIACHTADIDYMAMVAFHHCGNDKTSHVEQPLDVGVNHLIPIVKVTLIFGFQSSGKSSVVYKNVNLLPFFGDSVKSGFHCLTVSDVKRKGKNFCANCF